ncbi:hypothetical protein PMI33_04130 [Pseudomonas sp. GM67]|nr:hypothetical protein PMI33_04130 [Pseudomonas sp. GM67]
MESSWQTQDLQPLKIPVGVSLLAMVCQSTLMWLTHHREQARSYRGLRRLEGLCSPLDQEEKISV